MAEPQTYFQWRIERNPDGSQTLYGEEKIVDESMQAGHWLIDTVSQQPLRKIRFISYQLPSTTPGVNAFRQAVQALNQS